MNFVGTLISIQGELPFSSFVEFGHPTRNKAVATLQAARLAQSAPDYLLDFRVCEELRVACTQEVE
jgi:hypothetical protein